MLSEFSTTQQCLNALGYKFTLSMWINLPPHTESTCANRQAPRMAQRARYLANLQVQLKLRIVPALQHKPLSSPQGQDQGIPPRSTKGDSPRPLHPHLMVQTYPNQSTGSVHKGRAGGENKQRFHSAQSSLEPKWNHHI